MRTRLFTATLYVLIVTSSLLSAQSQTQQRYLYVPGRPLIWLSDDKTSLRVAAPSEIRICNLGKDINSGADDFSPVFSDDETRLYFCSNRMGSTSGVGVGRPSYDVYTCSLFRPQEKSEFGAHNADPSGRLGINTPNSEFLNSICMKTRRVYFTFCNRATGYGECDIYEAEMKPDGSWSAPVNVGPNVNSSRWESQASVTRDGTRMYFTMSNGSAYKDSNGDILYCDTDYMGGWKPAQILTPANTDRNEFGPYICNDNRTLIYSSNHAEKTIGEHDLYAIYRIDDSTWTKPLHLGPTINTRTDDRFASFSQVTNTLYYCSARRDNDEAMGGDDMYAAFVPSASIPLDSSVNKTALVSEDSTKHPQKVSLDVENGSNPRVTVHLPEYDKVELSAYSIVGELKLRLWDVPYASVGDHTLNCALSELPNGFYFFCLRTSNRMVIRRFVIGR